jgi:amidohydrolase
MSNRPDFRQVAHGLVEQLITDRRDLHQHPELGFQEFRTSKIIAERLRELGYDVTEGVAQTGVLGVIPPKNGGKLAMLRFDMDALPVEEQNQVEYVSLEAGKMHACGHDGHVAIGLGVAAALMENRAALGDGGVKLLFQPAEEGGGGAQRMVEAGAMENPRPDVSLGMHIWADLPLGVANVRSGPIMASADEFNVTITGKGGHGAQPQATIDAVLVAAQMVVALHTIVSRNVHPEQPAVLSVGSINAGTAHNIIAHTAILTGTIRTYDAEAREVIKQRLHEVVSGVAATYHAQAEITYHEMCPATVCAEEASAVVREAAVAVLGAQNVVASERTMGSEDMSVLLNEVPGCYFFLGAKNEQRELGVFAHHHPRFDFDEAVLPLGVAIMCEATTRYLNGSPA